MQKVASIWHVRLNASNGGAVVSNVFFSVSALDQQDVIAANLLGSVKIQLIRIYYITSFFCFYVQNTFNLESVFIK